MSHSHGYLHKNFLYVVPKDYILVTGVYRYYQFKLKCIIK